MDFGLQDFLARVLLEVKDYRFAPDATGIRSSTPRCGSRRPACNRSPVSRASTSGQSAEVHRRVAERRALRQCMEIRLTACSFDMDRPKSVRNARRESQPDRRLRARFDADVEAHYRTQISRFRADLRAAGGDGFVEPDLLDEAACLTRPRNVVRDSTSDRRACSSVSPSRQWLRSLAVLVEERLELCPFRDEVGDQHGCCSGTRDRQPTGRWSQTGCGRSGAIRGTFCR